MMSTNNLKQTTNRNEHNTISVPLSTLKLKLSIRNFLPANAEPKIFLLETIQYATQYSNEYEFDLNNIFELPKLMEEWEDQFGKLPKRLRDLVFTVGLSSSIHENGLQHPLHVFEENNAYTIYAGELRYLAFQLLSLTHWKDEEIKVKCHVLEKPSFFTYARDNLFYPLSSMDRARLAAILILEVHNKLPSHPLKPQDYRKAINLDFRSIDARKQQKRILEVLGGISVSRFSRIKALLNLSDAGMQFADDYDPPMRLLSELATYPLQYQDQILKIYLQQENPIRAISDQLIENKSGDNKNSKTREIAPFHVRSLARDFDLSIDVFARSVEKRFGRANAIKNLEQRIHDYSMALEILRKKE